MELTLCTDGQAHYVFSYGKQDHFITKAPVSILKKIVRAKCFEVIRPKKGSKNTPAIKLKDTYRLYSDLESHYEMEDHSGLSWYKFIFCTRENELFQYFSEIWEEQIFCVTDLIRTLNQYDDYRIGANYSKKGIQFFIENEFTDLVGKKMEGKKFYYPFLLHELEEDLVALKAQADLSNE